MKVMCEHFNSNFHDNCPKNKFRQGIVRIREVPEGFLCTCLHCGEEAIFKDLHWGTNFSEEEADK